MNEVLPPHDPYVDRLPQGERPASTPRTCGACNSPLADRRADARYCSDRCRTRHRRRDAHEKVNAAICQVETAVRALVEAVTLLDRIN